MQVSLVVYNGVSIPANSSPVPNGVPLTGPDKRLGVQGIDTVDQITSGAGIGLGVKAVTTSATEDFTAYLIRINAAGGDVTRTLPPAASCTGQIIQYKRIDASGNTVTVAGNGAETIDGSNTNTSMSSQYSKLRIQSNGVSWDIL